MGLEGEFHGSDESKLNLNALSVLFDNDVENKALTNQANELKSEITQELTSSIALELASAMQSKKSLDAAVGLEEELHKEKVHEIMESIAKTMFAGTKMKGLLELIPLAQDSPEIMEVSVYMCIDSVLIVYIVYKYVNIVYSVYMTIYTLYYVST